MSHCLPLFNCATANLAPRGHVFRESPVATWKGGGEQQPFPVRANLVTKKGIYLPACPPSARPACPDAPAPSVSIGPVCTHLCKFVSNEFRDGMFHSCLPPSTRYPGRRSDTETEPFKGNLLLANLHNRVLSRTCAGRPPRKCQRSPLLIVRLPPVFCRRPEYVGRGPPDTMSTLEGEGNIEKWM